MPNDPEAIVKGALAVLGNPTIRPETRARAARVRPRLAEGRDRLEGRVVPAARRERGAPAPRRLPRPPDLLSRWPAATSTHERSSSAAASPRRAAGCPRSSPACRCRRERGSTGAPSSPAASGSRSPSTAAPRCVRRCSTRASPAAAAASPQQKVLVSVFLDGGADALSLLAPTGDPLYRQLRPRLALAAGAGPAFAEDPSLTWHPSLAPLAQLHGEGKVSVMPGIGYDHPNQSHFTSRHFWEVGAADERLATGWLGRYLDRVGQARQPAAGALARLEPAAVARDGEDARGRRRRARPLRLLGARRLGRGVRPDGRRDRPARRASRPTATPASRQRATPRASRRGSTTS